MKTRAITGIIFIIILVAATLLNAYVFAIFFSLLGVLAAREFFMISKTEQTEPLTSLGLLVAGVLAALFAAYFLGFIGVKLLGLAIPFISLLFIASLFLKRRHPFADLALTLLGIGYGTIPFLFFIGLGFIQGGVFNPYIPMGFLIILWSNDTGAYLAGRAFGKTKLFERVSPNKTWEGFFGGMALAVLIALNLQQYFGSLDKIQWSAVAVVIAVFGTLGDLVESLLKRSLGIKDSGTILPGHGGILDRFDGLLIAAPLVYLLLMFLI